MRQHIRVSPRDEVAKKACNAGMQSQTRIKSRFVSSREVSLLKLAHVRFISAIAGWRSGIILAINQCLYKITQR